MERHDIRVCLRQYILYADEVLTGSANVRRHLVEMHDIMCCLRQYILYADEVLTGSANFRGHLVEMHDIMYCLRQYILYADEVLTGSANFRRHLVENYLNKSQCVWKVHCIDTEHNDPPGVMAHNSECTRILDWQQIVCNYLEIS